MKICIDTVIDSDIDTVWKAWNTPQDIMQWNAASDDWHTTASEVDLRVGGSFNSRMEAKDGSMGFDFSGTYTKVIPNELVEYELDDGRVVSINFSSKAGSVVVTQEFDAESQMEAERQRQGWQSVLSNFARHVESSN